MSTDTRRIRVINEGKLKPAPVVYWMGRNHRVKDNWSLHIAQEKAKELKAPLIVVFTLIDSFLNAPFRHYDFMIKGLMELEERLLLKDIPFIVLKGEPVKEIIKFTKKISAALLISDFEPLRIKEDWKKQISKKIKIPFWDIDSRNIIPCWQASNKLEFSAYTLRKKIEKLRDDYLNKIPSLKKHPYALKSLLSENNWDKLIKNIKTDKKVTPITWLRPGESAAQKELGKFIKTKLDKYAVDRNDPCIDGQSNLSPYLHFGHLSPVTILDKVSQAKGSTESKRAFLEELIVRRELSDNFCYYSSNYDNFKGAHNWAQTTLNQHRRDKREYVYTLNELEEAKTHDEAWNAAQMEMVIKGKMHGYMRMYWAKKILEWSKTPEDAIKTAVYLNDKYELDGRDTNGYTGIMWSICGVHDRAWTERRIFGKIRFMNYNGLKSKFKISKYVDKISKLSY